LNREVTPSWEKRMAKFVVERILVYRQPVLVEADDMIDARDQVHKGHGRAARLKHDSIKSRHYWPVRNATAKDEKWFKRQPKERLTEGP